MCFAQLLLLCVPCNLNESADTVYRHRHHHASKSNPPHSMHIMCIFWILCIPTIAYGLRTKGTRKKRVISDQAMGILIICWSCGYWYVYLYYMHNLTRPEGIIFFCPFLWFHSIYYMHLIENRQYYTEYEITREELAYNISKM